MTSALVSCAGESDRAEPVGVPNHPSNAGSATAGAGGMLGAGGHGAVAESGGASGRGHAGRGGASSGASGGGAEGGRAAAGRSGTENTGGMPAGATGGTTGSSVGGDGPILGFTCYPATPCEKGDRCVDCNRGEITVGQCAPDPTSDPDGYAAATSSCLTIGSRYHDCDGPEDCDAGQYCVLFDDTALGACESEPPLPANCCIGCAEGPRDCTLCWLDTDCPAGYLCQASDALPHDVGICSVAD